MVDKMSCMLVPSYQLYYLTSIVIYIENEKITQIAACVIIITLPLKTYLATLSASKRLCQSQVFLSD